MNKAAGEAVPRSYALTGPSIAPAPGLRAGRGVVSIVSQAGSQLEIPTMANARKTNHLKLERLDDRIAPATFTVTSYEDMEFWGGSDGTLREAIAHANSVPGPDLIVFNIPPDPVLGIRPIKITQYSESSPGPMVITDPLTIDGYTQPGASPRANASRIA